MEQRRSYQQQQRRKMEKKRRRRIRRIKVYFFRTTFLCLFIFLIAGMTHVINLLYHKIESTQPSFQKMKKEGLSSTVKPEEAAYDLKQLAQMGYDEAMLDTLFEMSNENPTVIKILNHIEDYPEELLELLCKNPETKDFVFQYPKLSKKAKIQEDLDLSDTYFPGEIPFFLQWDPRWGYCQYGKNYIALAGCGPTCLSMVYVGLTGDISKNPGIMSSFSAENGFLDSNNNTLWSLMSDGARLLGLHSKELSLDESVMIQELEQGHPIILSMRPGDFTTEGHFIVVSDYQDGKFMVHDPNSIIRSEQLWDYKTLSTQIKNLWSFSI